MATNKAKATKTKEKDKINVRIVEGENDMDEVFLTRDDPYVNEVKYVPRGTYKEGSFTEETLGKKEEG